MHLQPLSAVSMAEAIPMHLKQQSAYNGSSTLLQRAHRKDRLCGAMGVIMMHGTLGATIGPPADMLYAVDPDGVATMSPSPCTALTSYLKCARSNQCRRSQSHSNMAPRSLDITA
jgi:hypothetical protein